MNLHSRGSAVEQKKSAITFTAYSLLMSQATINYTH